jgi:uncharacterized protein (DUF488 family)
MSIQSLVTIGYEGSTPEDFLATLTLLGVDTLLDIREIAMSRRRGFAKTALREGLASVDIRYRHEPRLGSPKTIRYQLRDDNNYPRFFRDFQRYLNSQADLLDTLAEELHGTVALLCYERDYTLCHRRAVADAFNAITGITPQHQGVQGHAQRQAVARSRAHPGQGLPAA